MNNNKVVFLRLTCYTFLLLLTLSCKSKGESVKTDNNFPAIQIPGILTSQSDAAVYVVKNYWNKFLASERLTGLSHAKDGLILGIDSLKFEDAFGEYAAALCYVQPIEYISACNSIKKLFNVADSIAISGDSTFLFKLMALSEKYFYNPNSPVLNEELYLSTLESILSTKAIGEIDKMQYQYQFNICGLNRVGTPAADFEYKTLSKQGSLYAVKADYTLIFFNNPDCSACAHIKDKLKSTPIMQDLIDKGELKVLAMYIDEEIDLWRKNKDSYPANWIYAYDHQSILRDNNLYGLRAIPSLYLLDKDKKVLLKDAPVDKVIEYISSGAL